MTFRCVILTLCSEQGQTFQKQLQSSSFLGSGCFFHRKEFVKYNESGTAKAAMQPTSPVVNSPTNSKSLMHQAFPLVSLTCTSMYSGTSTPWVSLSMHRMIPSVLGCHALCRPSHLSQDPVEERSRCPLCWVHWEYNFCHTELGKLEMLAVVLSWAGNAYWELVKESTLLLIQSWAPEVVSTWWN